MNWLGKIIQTHVKSSDTVLDIGCGIFQAISNSLNSSRSFGITKKNDRLKCHSLLGCELVEKYIDVAKNHFPVLKMDVSDIQEYEKFPNNSFDVVICLDVLEHMKENIAILIIHQMIRIARKKVIIYTPSKFESNEKNIDNAWNLGENPFQEHRSFVSPNMLKDFGFVISYPEPDKNTLAILDKGIRMG